MLFSKRKDRHFVSILPALNMKRSGLRVIPYSFLRVNGLISEVFFNHNTHGRQLRSSCIKR